MQLLNSITFTAYRMIKSIVLESTYTLCTYKRKRLLYLQGEIAGEMMMANNNTEMLNQHQSECLHKRRDINKKEKKLEDFVNMLLYADTLMPLQ